MRIVQPGLRSAMWTVTGYRAGLSCTWASTEGGVRTSATHIVVARGSSGSRLILQLRQSGLLALVVSLFAGSRIRRVVALEAAGLAAEAERRAQGGPGDLSGMWSLLNHGVLPAPTRYVRSSPRC